MAEKIDRRAFLSGAGKAAIGTAAAAAVVAVGVGKVGTVEAAPIENVLTHKKPDSLPILAFRGITPGSKISVETISGDKVPMFATKVGNDGVELALQGEGTFSIGVHNRTYGETKWQVIECELGQYLVVDTRYPDETVKDEGWGGPLRKRGT